MRWTIIVALAWAFAAPVAAQSLTIALPANVNTLDPAMTASVGTDLSVISHLYTPLIIRDADLKLQPALALSWSQPDDRTWRFALAPGAHFANGEAMDAAAVKWNFDRVRDPKVNARIKSWFDLVSDVKAISATELEIDTSAPFPALPDQLSMFFLLPPQWAATHDPSREVSSGGPYSLASYVPGDRIVLKAEPHYWGPKPLFSDVIFRIVPEAAARVAGLLAGEIDLTTGLPVEEVKRVQASGRASAGSVPSTRSQFVKFNLLTSPLKDNLLLRQALNYAIDKQAIADTIFGGLAPVSQCQVLTSAYTGFNPALHAYPYDPARAKAMVQQAGAAGLTLTMDVPTAIYLNGQDVAQVVASQLEDIGLHVIIHEMDFGAFMNRYIRTHDMSAMAYLTYAWPTLDADGILTLMAPGNVYSYWDDQPLGDLLTKARSTMDKAGRQALYAQATARICEQAPAIFLLVQPATYGVGHKITWHARGDDWVRAVDAAPK